MLRQAIPAANPMIQKLVDELFAEDRRNDLSDRRAANRVAFSRPVDILIREPELMISGISNNMSPLGMGIISSESIPAECQAKLVIFSESVNSSTILGELRWCKPFGDKWFVSGWKFVQVLRS